MFEDCTPNSEIKIIDFGLSTTFKPGEVLTKRVGTPYTMAPEVLNCNYTSKADLWSIGKSFLLICIIIEVLNLFSQITCIWR